MGLINIYNSVNAEHKTLNGNGKLKDILAGYDFSKSIILKSGNRLSPDYEVTENDVIYIRTVPGVTTTTAIVIAVVATIAAGVAVGVSLYQSQKAKEEMEKAQRDAKNLADAQTKLPFLRGAKNKSALGNAIQYVMGETYNSPYLQTDGFYSIGGKDGDKQYWNAILSCGYTGQIIEKLYSGNNVIKEWDDTTPQTQAYGTDENSLYHDPENIIEITQNGTFKNKYFRQKIKGKLIGAEIKNDYDAVRDSKLEYLVKECELYTQKVEVCIEFNSLRAYNTKSETWESKSVTVLPEWSNGEKNPDGSLKWTPFYFETSSTAEWTEAGADMVESLIESGKLESKYIPQLQYTQYFSKSDDVRVEKNSGIKKADKVYYYANTDYRNTITRNSNKTLRFVASKEFTPEEAFNKDISIRLSRSMKSQNNSQEDCYLLYMNCYCYDNRKSSVTNLVPCMPFENPEKLTMLGLRFISNDNTKDLMDEMNVISYATARKVTADGFTESKYPTRNIIDWICDILTSETHRHSRISDEELYIASFYAARVYCEENDFNVDGIVTSAIKKRDLLNKLLNIINASLFYNSDGLIEIAIDKAETVPVALLNAETIKSVTYAKTLSRKPNGIKLTFTNRDTWQIDTRYAMIDGREEHNSDDTLIEKNVEFVTDDDFIYKIGQRTLRHEALQPMTITADIGREGDYYPLYSLVLVQLKQLHQGIASSTISSLIKSEGVITGINITDQVYLSPAHRYGVVIQGVTPESKNIYYREVLGTGETRTLVFKDSIPEDAVSFGNVLSFGQLKEDGSFDLVTNKMKIYGIGRGSDGGVSLTLKPYTPELYEYGTIPEYKSNLTPPVTPGNSVPAVTQNQLLQAMDKVRTITNVQTFYALSETNTEPAKESFSTEVVEMTSSFRYLWTFTRYVYKDGSFKDTNIVLSGVYGEQGTPGSGYRLDITPDSVSVFANTNGQASVPSVQFGVYFFLDTQDLTPDTTFKAYIGNTEVGTWENGIVTIPTSYITEDTTQIKIIAQYYSVERTAFCSVTRVYGNTIFQMLPSAQNIKVSKDGSIVPEYITIQRQKITAAGYFRAGDDEGVIYGKTIPGGELTKIGVVPVESEDSYDAEKVYFAEFEPFMLSVETEPGSGEDIVIGNEDNSALIFYARK